MPDIYVSPKKEKPIGKLKPKVKKEKVVKKKTTNPLSAFASKPLGFHFETQERQEKIVLLLRRHPITNISWIVTTFVVVLSPPVIISFASLNFIPSGYRLIITLAWYLLTFAFALEKFLSWFFNVNIITDERIIDIDFPSILYKDISETKIDQIQDVSMKVGGFIRSLFNFGDVLIQTAGAVPEIHFSAVPNPEQVSKILNELILEEEQEKLDGRVR